MDIAQSSLCSGLNGGPNDGPLNADVIAEASTLEEQTAIDELFADVELPLSSGCTGGGYPSVP